MKLLCSGLLGLLLAACCPAVGVNQPTAFRAEVVGISPSVSALQLQPRQDAPLLSLQVGGARLEAADGTPLPLEAFGAGDSVYVRGTVTAGEVRAAEVRRIE